MISIRGRTASGSYSINGWEVRPAEPIVPWLRATLADDLHTPAALQAVEPRRHRLSAPARRVAAPKAPRIETISRTGVISIRGRTASGSYSINGWEVRPAEPIVPWLRATLPDDLHTPAALQAVDAFILRAPADEGSLAAID